VNLPPIAFTTREFACPVWYVAPLPRVVSASCPVLPHQVSELPSTAHVACTAHPQLDSLATCSRRKQPPWHACPHSHVPHGRGMCHLAQRQDPRWAAHASVQPHKRHTHRIYMHTVCMCMCKCLCAACPMMCLITLAHSAAARLHICSRSEPDSRAASGNGGAIGLPWPRSLPRSPQDAHAQIACRHSRHHSSGCPTAVLAVVQPQSSM